MCSTLNSDATTPVSGEASLSRGRLSVGEWPTGRKGAQQPRSGDEVALENPALGRAAAALAVRLGLGALSS